MYIIVNHYQDYNRTNEVWERLVIIYRNLVQKLHHKLQIRQISFKVNQIRNWLWVFSISVRFQLKNILITNGG